MAREYSKKTAPLSITHMDASVQLEEALEKAANAALDGLFHKAGVCHCVACNHAFVEEGGRNAVPVQLLNAGGLFQYGCDQCDSVTFDDGINFPVYAYAELGCPVFIRYFVHMTYGSQVRFELMQGASRTTATCEKGDGAWLPCKGGMKSPIFRNTKSGKLFKSLEEHEKQGRCSVTGFTVTPYYRHSDGRIEKMQPVEVDWERRWYTKKDGTQVLLFKSEALAKDVAAIKKAVIKEVKDGEKDTK